MKRGRATTSPSRADRPRGRLRALLFVAAALLALPGAPLRSQEGGWQAGDGFRWRARPGLESVGEREAPRIADIFREARDWTGLPPDPRPFDVVWVADRRQLAEELGAEVPDWFAAVAVPFQRRLIIATEVAGDLARLRTTLRHELLHLAMADLGPEAWERLPAWFHEGCAESFAGDVYLGSLGVRLSWRAFRNDLPPLVRYQDGFGKEALHAAVGYALGHAFVDSLQRRYGADIVRRILARVRAGAPFERALLDLTGLSQIQHEQELHAELRSLAALAGDLYEQIFLILALLLVVLFPFAMRRRRRRRQEFEDRWARQERTDDLDPVLASGQWQEPGDGNAEAEPLDDWVDEEW